MTRRTLLIMAGGTGGHIMPGLAVAQRMQERGWRVVWLGHPERMEGRLVPERGIDLVPLRFAGLRGKGAGAVLKLPFTLANACLQANKALGHVRPDVVLGMGGYVAFPGGLMAALRRMPLVVHEQNAVAGTANRWLARIATRVLTGFPGALPGGLMVGNPVRSDILGVAPAVERYAARKGPLRVLVVGGSLGAAALNGCVPRALALMPPDQRPRIVHQTGEQHQSVVQKTYADLGVQADVVPFIVDMAAALADADLVICRAGAMTVAEVAAVGVAALFIPLPHAIDDHQTANARYLSDCQGAWLQSQASFTPDWLAQWLGNLERNGLSLVARHAHEHASLHAAERIADVCEQTVKRT